MESLNPTNSPVGQLNAQQSVKLCKYLQQNKINKIATWGTIVPSGTQRYLWGISIPSDLMIQDEQCNYLQGALLPGKYR